MFRWCAPNPNDTTIGIRKAPRPQRLLDETCQARSYEIISVCEKSHANTLDTTANPFFTILEFLYPRPESKLTNSLPTHFKALYVDYSRNSAIATEQHSQLDQRWFEQQLFSTTDYAQHQVLCQVSTQVKLPAANTPNAKGSNTCIHPKCPQLVGLTRYPEAPA